MREHEPANTGFLRYLSTLAGVEMDRVGPARRKGTVQHGEIGIAAQPHEGLAILRVPRVGQRPAFVFDPIAQAMEIGAMEDSVRDDLCLADPEGAIRDFFITDHERYVIKTR